MKRSIFVFATASIITVLATAYATRVAAKGDSTQAAPATNMLTWHVYSAPLEVLLDDLGGLAGLLRLIPAPTLPPEVSPEGEANEGLGETCSSNDSSFAPPAKGTVTGAGADPQGYTLPFEVATEIDGYDLMKRFQQCGYQPITEEETKAAAENLLPVQYVQRYASSGVVHNLFVLHEAYNVWAFVDIDGKQVRSLVLSPLTVEKNGEKFSLFAPVPTTDVHEYLANFSCR